MQVSGQFLSQLQVMAGATLSQTFDEDLQPMETVAVVPATLVAHKLDEQLESLLAGRAGVPDLVTLIGVQQGPGLDEGLEQLQVDPQQSWETPVNDALEPGSSALLPEKAISWRGISHVPAQ